MHGWMMEAYMNLCWQSNVRQWSVTK